MSRTYCGMALGGTTPDCSIGPGSMAVAVSMVTMSPELIVSTGLIAALKFPMCTVAGLGISVYSAQRAFGDASADKSKLQINSARILAIASSLFRRPQRAAQSRMVLQSPHSALMPAALMIGHHF